MFPLSAWPAFSRIVASRSSRANCSGSGFLLPYLRSAFGCSAAIPPQTATLPANLPGRSYAVDNRRVPQ